MPTVLEKSVRSAHEFGASLLTLKLVQEAIDESESARLSLKHMIEEFGNGGVSAEIMRDSREAYKNADQFLKLAAETYEYYRGISA